MFSSIAHEQVLLRILERSQLIVECEEAREEYAVSLFWIMPEGKIARVEIEILGVWTAI
jgi:hypothetical protein